LRFASGTVGELLPTIYRPLLFDFDRRPFDFTGGFARGSLRFAGVAGCELVSSVLGGFGGMSLFAKRGSKSSRFANW
jgi:hypothetical protein